MGFPQETPAWTLADGSWDPVFALCGQVALLLSGLGSHLLPFSLICDYLSHLSGHWLFVMSLMASELDQV